MGLNNNLGRLTEILTVSGSNIGIGNTSPNTLLYLQQLNPTRGILATIKNSASSGHTGAQIHFVQNSIADWVVGQPAGETSFAFWNNRYPSSDGTERMRITSGGNVGIGTTNPLQKLVISNGGAQGLEIGADATYDVNLAAYNRATSAYIPFRFDASAFYFLTGRVGIGTTNPTTNLHIKHSGAYAGIIVDNTGTTGGGGISLYRNGSQIGYVGVLGSLLGSTASDLAIFSETGKTIQFFTDGTTTPKATITTGGNLLVGTTTDEGYKLYTNGTIGTSTGFGSSRRVTITALNTDFQIFPTAYSGLVVIRDNTNGGSGAWIQDPNMGSIQIANNMPGTWSISYNFGNGTTNIRKTSGTVPVLIGYALYGNG